MNPLRWKEVSSGDGVRIAVLVLLRRNDLSSSRKSALRSIKKGSGLTALDAFSEESLLRLESMWGTNELLLTEAKLCETLVLKI